MAKQIQFEGTTHSFPDDFSDDEISQALMGGGAPPQTSAFMEMGKNVGAGAEALGRTGLNILSSAAGFVPAQLAGDASMDDPVAGMMRSLERGPEAVEKYIPRVFDKTQETEGKIGEAFRAATDAFGTGSAAASQIPGSPQFFARKAQELVGMNGENEARAAGELGMNLVPLPLLGKGKAKGVEPKAAARPEGFTERFDAVRGADASLKDLSDAQIVEALEQRSQKDNPATMGDQGQLFDPDQLNPERRQRLNEWQKEEDTRFAAAMEAQGEGATGMKDMFGYTNDPKFLEQQQLDMLKGEQKFGEPPALETPPVIPEPILQTTRDAVRAAQESPLGMTPERAELLPEMARDAAVLEGIAKSSESRVDAALARIAELEKMEKAGDRNAHNRLSTELFGSDWQGSARHIPGTVYDMARYLAKQGEGKWLKSDFAAPKSEQAGPRMGPENFARDIRAAQTAAAAPETSNLRYVTTDRELLSEIQSGKITKLSQALDWVADKGTAWDRVMAKVIRTGLYIDADVMFGRAKKASDKVSDLDRGTFYGKTRELVIHHSDKTVGTLLHEATHGTLLGHINRYLRAKEAALLPQMDQMFPGHLKSVRAMEDLFHATDVHMQKTQPTMRSFNGYAFTNLHEFSSELMSNLEFQDSLKKIKVADLQRLHPDTLAVAPKHQSVWQALLGRIKELIMGQRAKYVPDNAFELAMAHQMEMLRNTNASEQFHFSGSKPKLPDEYKSKDLLPPELKHLEKYITDKKPGTVQAPQQAIRAVDNGPLTDIVKRFTPDLRPWETVQKEFQGLKDISGGVLEQIGQRVVSGGKMYSWIKEHPALKWAVDTAYDAKASVESRAQELLHHPERGLSTKWQALSSKDQTSLWEVIHDGKRAKKTFSDAELADRGLSPEQIGAYRNARQILDELWTEFNAERLAKGMDPVPPVEGYWPSRWQGNWELITRAPSQNGIPGKILRVDRANSRGKLEKLAEKVKADGKYEVDAVQPTPRAGELKDSFGLFNHLMESVGRDTPEGRVLNSAMDRYAQELADTRRLFRRHYEPSSGVEGYLGDTEGASPIRNAKDALRSVEGYVQDGLDWMYTQRASRELSGFFREADQMGLRNVGAFGRLYWDKLNNHEGQMARMINRMVEIPMESLGYDRNLLKAAGLELKSQATLLMLAYFKPIFIAAQFVQPHQFVAPLIQLMEGRLGRSSKSSMIELGFEAHKDTTNALMGSFDGKDGAFRQSAIDYLRKNRIIDPHFMETANTVLSPKGREWVHHLQGASLMAFSERYARTNAFFQYARWLKEVQPELGQKAIFDTAAELAEGSMVNYRRMERAQIFHDLGIVGDMASGLTTFKMNLASQLYMYMKEALVSKNPKPIMTLLAVQSIYAGAMGLPLREEFDRLINYAKGLGILSPKAMTPTEALLRFANKIGGVGGDAVRYGPFSAATGIDISPTFSAGALVPDVGQGFWKGIMPVGGKIVDVGVQGANVAGKALGMLTGGSGPTSSDLGALGKAALPSSAQWALEKAQQSPQTGIVPNPTRGMEGTVRRPQDLGTKPWIARMLSARTTKESTQVRADQQQFKTDEAIKTQQKGLIERATELQADHKDWTPQMKEYIDLGGDPTTFVNAVKGAAIKQNTTTQERTIMDAKSRQKAERYLRLKEMYRD